MVRGMDLRETPQRVELPVAKMVGGAAPQDRRCRRILESGRQCRDWSVRGWDLCSRHGRYRGTSVERPIEVPLLEDDASVTLVLSQAVRALAWGTIPPANGRAVIAGCKAATEVLKLRVTVAKLEAQLGQRAEPLVTDVVEDRGDLYSRQMSQEEVTRAWLEERARRSELAGQRVSESADCEGEGSVESHVCEHRAEPSASSGQAMGHPEVAGDEVVERPCEEVMVETMVAGAETAVTALWRAIEADVLGEPEVEADAAWEPVVHVEHPPRFRDLKDQWERAARRFGESLADLKVPRKDEDREMWKAALRRPWDGKYPARG